MLSKRSNAWRPQLEHTYPYLPDRTLKLSEPEPVAVYINVPDKRRPHESNDAIAAIFGDVKVGVVFEKSGILISHVYGSSFWVSDNNPLHKINLKNIFTKDPELADSSLSSKGLFDDDGSLRLCVGFINVAGKLETGAPYVTLIIQSSYNSDSDEDYDSGAEIELEEYEEDEQEDL